MTTIKAEDKITRAKTDLVGGHPFFASLLLTMPVIEDSACETIATDGESIYFARAYLDSKSQSEVKFLLAHETLHCVFQHMYTRGERDSDRWNIACDYVINDILTKEKPGSIGIMPPGGLLNSALVEKAGGTAEAVYRLLGEMPKPPKGRQRGKPGSGSQGQGAQGTDDDAHGFPKPGEAGGSFDKLIDKCKDDATRSAKQAELRVKVIQAANAAKAAGGISAGLELIVKEMVKTPVDWRSVLHRFFSERTKTDWSYARPKRRFLAEDIYLPSLTGESLGDIVFAVDCSGSVVSVLDSFAAEMQAVKEAVNPKSMTVIYFDSEVLRVDTFSQDEDLEVNATGGGGTAFSPIFRTIEQLGIDPAACVVLTDLECNDFGPAPAYPVLWASIGSQSAPFGEVVEVKE